MNAHTTEADRVANEGCKAGEHLWLMLEASYQGGLKRLHLVDLFEELLERLIDRFPICPATDLFEASAMKSIAHEIDGKRRSQVERKANETYWKFVGSLTSVGPQHMREVEAA